jgi:hypothetical protein
LASAICLVIATTVIITKVVRSDARVCVPIGSGNPAFTASFVAAFDAAGGKTAAGCGYSPVHGWGPGWIQDLRGAKQGNAAIMALHFDRTVRGPGERAAEMAHYVKAAAYSPR